MAELDEFRVYGDDIEIYSDTDFSKYTDYRNPDHFTLVGIPDKDMHIIEAMKERCREDEKKTIEIIKYIIDDKGELVPGYRYHKCRFGEIKVKSVYGTFLSYDVVEAVYPEPEIKIQKW
jgi:hypothetical protein